MEKSPLRKFQWIFSDKHTMVFNHLYSELIIFCKVSHFCIRLYFYCFIINKHPQQNLLFFLIKKQQTQDIFRQVFLLKKCICFRQNSTKISQNICSSKFQVPYWVWHLRIRPYSTWIFVHTANMGLSTKYQYVNQSIDLF